MDLTGRVSILHAQKINKELPISTAADLLGVNRTSVYYKPAEPSEQEITAKNLIYMLHTENPAWGSRQLSKQLKVKNTTEKLLISNLAIRKSLKKEKTRC